ncbi:MAG: M28 family peptidase, partial [Planctomycetota bacterium]
MRRVWLTLLVLAGALLAKDPRKDELPGIDGKAILGHIKYLADDDLQGRAAGSAGAKDAADYAARHFRGLGLKPAGGKGSFFQDFSLPRGFEVDPSTLVEASRGKKKTTLRYGKDLKPLSVSSPGDVTAAALFAGYGIAAPELGYDDYEGIDVKGRVVIVLRHAPGYAKSKSPFSLPGTRRRYAGFAAKASTAVGAGAAALIVVNDPANVKPKDDEPRQNVGGSPCGIPVIHVTYKAGRKLAKTCGFSIAREQSRIDKKLQPRSRLLEEAQVRVHAVLEAKLLAVRNVCALLEAPGPVRTKPEPEGAPAAAAPVRARETVVVGGHYDHLGLGAYGSLAGSKGKGAIHNGADDNASGTSTVLEIAAFLKARRPRLKRDVLFVLFTAEEMGLLGSKHYVGSPRVPLEQCVAMVNLDMVGRLGRGRLQVGGVGTSPIFQELIERKNRAHRI